LADHRRRGVELLVLVAVAAFYKWYGTRHGEPDELGKMIIGSLFTIAGGRASISRTNPGRRQVSLSGR
jgi:hypothetical protein